MLANLRAAADFVVSGLDNRDAVGVEVANHQLAAVGFEGETDGGAAHVKQRHQMVVFLAFFQVPAFVSAASRNDRFQSDRPQSNRSYLRRAGACDEGLGRIRQDRNVFRLLAHGQRGAYA